VDKLKIISVCIDDFALKKRQRYGTVMVDIESRKIVDMIESRETADVSSWLSEYPNLRIVSRDGSQSYAAAITEANPNAMQISDRFSVAVVKIYLSSDFSPINAHYGKQREGKLEPFREDVFRWKTEGLTYREIHERIQAKGYLGTQDAIRGFISKERRIRRDLQAMAGGDSVELIDKKWLIRLLYKPIEDIKGITPKQLTAIYAHYPMAEKIISIVNEFQSLLKAKSSDALLPWMTKASALGLPEIDAFIGGLKQDINAVTNAITSDFSNGLAEGKINKIKVIKRIMYGRCKFSTLKNKCLLLEYL